MRTWKHLRTPKAQVIERKAKAALLDEKETWEMDFALKSIKKERKKKHKLKHEEEYLYHLKVIKV